MQLLTILSIFFLIPNVAFSLDKSFLNEYFISDIEFNKNEVEVFIGNVDWTSDYFYTLVSGGL